jgi:hypothetical protein
MKIKYSGGQTRTKRKKIHPMRKRFELQLNIGQTPISEIYINPKSKNALDQLIAALKEIYCDKEYNDKIFNIIEKYLPKVDKNNGRPGMNLWTIFVLAQVRLCLGLDYNMLHNLSNNHSLLRKLLGISEIFGEEPVVFEYQNIYDNVSSLSDAMLVEINDVIVEFGHRKVFKKKETEALRLKTDSFVVESNVHFPTDYNLLWDCSRKCLDTVTYFLRKYPHTEGWRKTNHWRRDLKSLMRKVGRIGKGGGKNKQEKLQKAACEYIEKNRLLLLKLVNEKGHFPLNTLADLKAHYALENYMRLLSKHIDLVERRMIKGEIIPHSEKMMSIFETYTEWIVKGKTRPSVELGKNVSVTSDQYHLMVHHKVMNEEQDRDIVVETVDRVLNKYNPVDSMSFDKGHWNSDNRALLELEIPCVVLPKLGRRSAKEKEIEESKIFKRLKNKHSAIESNINELEHRGLNRCPDRGYGHFKTYIALGVCAYNLKKIGKKILENRLKEPVSRKAA